MLPKRTARIRRLSDVRKGNVGAGGLPSAVAFEGRQYYRPALALASSAYERQTAQSDHSQATRLGNNDDVVDQGQQQGRGVWVGRGARVDVRMPEQDVSASQRHPGGVHRSQQSTVHGPGDDVSALVNHNLVPVESRRAEPRGPGLTPLNVTDSLGDTISDTTSLLWNLLVFQIMKSCPSVPPRAWEKRKLRTSLAPVPV
jgi:hypothetical protein